PVGNLSGTLALELWALPAPYLGGAFAGAQIGAVVLGSLAGQAEWQDVQVELPTFALAPGQWHLALMLREWTGNGYLTRDYSNFAIPVVVSEAPAAGVEPAVDAPAPAADAVAVAPVAASVAAPELAPARKPAAKRAKPATGVKVADKAPGRKPAVRVSLNNGSEWDLLSLPGVSPKVAAGIVAGRPWEAVDDLSKVKGIGPKLLEQLRAVVRL
nr:helix-hairpin-helix domain-containing protein [Zoogloeaceae bacterium]